MRHPLQILSILLPLYLAGHNDNLESFDSRMTSKVIELTLDKQGSQAESNGSIKSGDLKEEELAIVKDSKIFPRNAVMYQQEW